MTKRAVTYARVSYDDSGTDGRNLDSQQDMCREHCRKKDYQIVLELAEDEKGASGTDFDLPQLTRLLEMAQAGEFDVLVVREVDRLSRDQIKAAIIRRDLRKCGVVIEYVLYDFAPGASGDLHRNMLEAFAEFERKSIIVKLGRGRRNSVKSGNINVAGRPPYGYTVAEKDEHNPCRLVVNEPEAQIVRMVFDWYTAAEDDDRLTMNGITRRLSELGIPTPSENNPLKGGGSKRRGTCEWNRVIVGRMLKSETYNGRWYYGKRKNVEERDLDQVDPGSLEKIKAKIQAGQKHRSGQKYAINNPREHWLARDVPVIIDSAIWQAAQDRVTANRRNAWRPTGEEYLLRRLLTCEKCGASVKCESTTGRGIRKYRYYKCNARRNKLGHTKRCDQVTFRADWVDAEVWRWIKELLTEPDKLQKAMGDLEHEGERLAAPIRRRLTVLDELIAENKAEKDRLMDLYLHKVYSLDEISTKKAHLEETLARQAKERAKLDRAVRKQIRSGAQARAVLDFAEAQGPNVEKATKRFDVRRGLMEDLDVEANLAVDGQGAPVVHASCVLGKMTFRQVAPTTS